MRKASAEPSTIGAHTYLDKKMEVLDDNKKLPDDLVC